jgi:hypothetical protein
LFNVVRLSLFIGAIFPLFVGYRRINHGVLVYAGKSKLVSLTSFVRVFVLAFSLLSFYYLGSSLSGNTIVAISVALSYFLETVASDLLVRKYALNYLTKNPSSLIVKSAWVFCSPMILSSLISQLMLPVGAAVLFRLPQAQLSLVIWPAVSGFLQLARTPGSALIELTASIGDNPENFSKIEKFTFKIGLVLLTLLLIFAFTPLANFYFGRLGGLNPEYANFAAHTMMFAVFFPALETRLWYLTGAAYALKMTKLGAHATIIATSLGLFLYAIAIRQSYIPGAVFVVLMWTAGTIAESSYFKYRITKAKLAKDSPLPIQQYL